MTHTDKLTVIANALITKLQNDANLGPSTHLVPITSSVDGSLPAVKYSDIYYGDQSKIPRVPSICVEPSNKNKGFDGSSRPPMVRNDFVVFILIYHAGTEDQTTRRQADELGEAVEALFNQDPQLNNGGASPANDLVISSIVTAFESGYTYRSQTLYRSVRMSWTGYTKIRLS